MPDKNYCYKYPRPALTTDAVVFRFDEPELFVLLVERGNEPFKGQWAFPGGFVNMDETTERAVQRELEEETGLSEVSMEQLHTFSEPNRDPRHRTVSVVYFTLIAENKKVSGGDDAARAKWFSVKQLPGLAFDHEEIMKTAVLKLYDKINLKPLEFEQFNVTSLRKIKDILLSII